MKFNALLLLTFTLLMFSCDKQQKRQATDLKKNTPEVLDDNRSDIASISKRYSYDIVQELYEEAMEKDSQLKKLNNSIGEIASLKNDSLEDYRKYAGNNKSYWSAAQRYIDLLQDSVLQQTTKRMFKKLEADYKKTISHHETKLDSLNSMTVNLLDQQTLMKVMVTLPMIQNYQRNEIPSKQPLDGIIKQYDDLLKATQKYTKDGL